MQEEELVKYDVFAHLKKISALLSMYDALKMSLKFQTSLIYALSRPEDFCQEAVIKGLERITVCMFMITLGDDDMCAEMSNHNCPLFITGHILTSKIS